MTYYPPRFLLRRAAILRRLKAGGSFLEIGPGEYHLSRELARKFATGSLVEFHPEAKERYTASLPPADQARIDLVTADFMQTSLSQPFDCVIACEVLEHVEDDAAFLRKMAAELKPGGQIIISVPAHEHYWSTHDELVGHLRRYSRKQLLDALKDAGLEQARVYSYGEPFIHFFRHARQILALAQKRRKAAWDVAQKTKRSGIDHAPSGMRWLGLLVNPITFWPLDLVGRLFEHNDRSDGYIAVAQKPRIERELASEAAAPPTAQRPSAKT